LWHEKKSLADKVFLMQLAAARVEASQLEEMNGDLKAENFR
jgi:hypothetical protein